MSAQTPDTGNATLDSVNKPADATNKRYQLPEITFDEPTEEEKKRLESFFVTHPVPDSLSEKYRVSAPSWKDDRPATSNDYVSFGDNGTTVTVNAHGSIMQITRSLGHGHSGLFCVDIADVSRPIYPQIRLEKLMQMSKNPESGMRLLYLSNLQERASFAPRKPKIEFVFNRWPRFTIQPASPSDGPTKETSTTDGEKVQPIITPSETSAKQSSRTGQEKELAQLSLQYFCHKGTVFQRYSFYNDPESALSLLDKSNLLFIRRNFLIRTSDLANDSKFNRADWNDQAYISTTGPNRCSHVAIHRMTEAEAEEIGIKREEYWHDDGPKAVALVITAFINGKAQMLDQSPSYLFINLAKKTREELEVPGKVEITIGYRLQPLTSKQDWRQFMIPASSLRMMAAHFSENPGRQFQRIRWSSHDHVDFITGRNLEHILSVCSMPIPKHRIVAKTENETERVEAITEEEMDTTSLAFTCGDISGHRIASSAAFFAFEFLIKMLQYLCDANMKTKNYMHDPKDCTCRDITNAIFPEPKCDACGKLELYIQDLRVRILKTLEAHLKWSASAKANGSLGIHHHWITGKGIKDWNNQTGFGPASLTDTPFEIIKTYDLHQFYVKNKPVVESIESDKRDHLEIMNDLQEQSILAKRLETSIRPWLKRLYESDKRCQYVFPRPQKDGMKKYHLGEHVWIWKATKCVKALGLDGFLELPQLHESEPGNPEPNHREKGEESPSEVSEKQDQSDWSEREGGPNNTDQPQRQEPAKNVLRYQTEELQRTILKRFTTRNPQTQQRMLATCRTPSESRFLFHAKDTALFYAMDDGFFDREMKRSSKRSNWANKVAVWRETVEVQAEHEETQTLEWENPLYYALALIISSRRKRINRLSPDEMLDASANILFALSSSGGLFPGHLNEKREPVAFEDEPQRDKYWHATFEIPYILWKYGKSQLETPLELEKADGSGNLQQGTLHVKGTGQLRQPMSKKMEFATFNSSVDKSRLIEISDDWLREPPSFLMFDSRVDVSVPDRDFGRVIDKALDGWSVTFGSSNSLTGTVFDVPRGCANRKTTNDLKRSLLSNIGILGELRLTRTVQCAKKRLIWLPKADRYTALACYLSSPDMERDNLSAFFDRHASYEKHFSDGTSAALNEWSTELHLSYFRRAGPYDTGEIRKNTRNMIPDLSFILLDEKPAETSIVRSSMSFRFVGDFFDRYWTCHFLESSPTTERDKDEYEKLPILQSRLSYLGFEGVNDTKVSKNTKQPWQQRKVLELLLFEYILNDIYSKTKEVFDWVRGGIFKKDNISTVNEIKMASVLQKPFAVQATFPLNPLAESLQDGAPSLLGDGSVGYFAMAERWRFFDKVLQAMEEDLSGNLETISLWSCREKDREPEGPQWTRDDEMTFRRVINQLQVMTEKRTRDLDDLNRAIRIFRDSFNGKLETMRSDLEYQGSENINLFTYVTVIFMPLGFATGIFSMSGAPTHSVLVNVIKLSLVALAITLFALSNAKTTGTTVVRPIILILRSINNRILSPLLQPFCVLGNLLLAGGLIAECVVKSLFHLFLVIPLTKLLDRWDKSGVKSWNVESMKTSYQGIVEFNRLVVDKKVPLDASKTVRRFYNNVKNKKEEKKQAEKKKNDLERGDAGN